MLPPGQKLAFAAVLLILALVTPPPLQLLISLWLAVWIVGYAGIPARFYLPMLLLPLGFALSSLPAIVINGVSREAFPTVHADMWRGLSQPVAGWNLYISKLGLSQALRLLTRSLAATSAMFFLLLTTPFSELIQVLRKLGLPPLLLDLMVHVYGFIFTLMAIVDEIMVAQRARSGYSSWRRSLRSLGLLTGQLLQRSMNTYRGLSMGLAARGFRGDLRLVSCVNHRSSPRLQAEAIGGCALRRWNSCSENVGLQNNSLSTFPEPGAMSEFQRWITPLRRSTVEPLPTGGSIPYDDIPHGIDTIGPLGVLECRGRVPGQSPQARPVCRISASGEGSRPRKASNSSPGWRLPPWLSTVSRKRLPVWRIRSSFSRPTSSKALKASALSTSAHL